MIRQLTLTICDGSTCQHKGKECPAYAGEPHDSWGCTLPDGHEGPHCACGGFGPNSHNYFVWEEECAALKANQEGRR